MLIQFKNGQANIKKIMGFLDKNNDGKIYKNGKNFYLLKMIK